MKIHLISGFLGSGKTTAIQRACDVLSQKKIKCGVISNDQGLKLVDADFFRSLNIPNRKVVNGCFCCNYNDLDSSIQSLIETNQPDVIFAESVGSCTDIVATVMKPLLRYRADATVTVSVFADVQLCQMLLTGANDLFDKHVNYIYYKQLEEAGIIVINKIDLVSEAQLTEIKKLMSEKYPGKILLYQNSLHAKNTEQWLEVLETDHSSALLASLEIDYDIYGEGEAMMAWFDEELGIYCVTQDAIPATIGLMENIYKKIIAQGYSIGHLKFLLDDKIKISYTALSGPGLPGDIYNEKKFSASLLINARVQVEPQTLSQLVALAIKETEIRHGCKIIVESVASFKPGYPKPTHRIV